MHLSDDDINWDEEFADEPKCHAMSPAQRKRLLSIMEKLIDMGMAAVYGDKGGYCPHLDRQNYHCTIWEDRPLRCWRYDCRDDKTSGHMVFPTISREHFHLKPGS